MVIAVSSPPPSYAAYDKIGRTYARYRRPDPRIAKRILEALDGAVSIVNVGSGTGSYEPAGEGVVAVEPSLTMIRQRPAGAAPVVRAVAEDLPFPSGSFDAALAILTVHHWSDPVAGLRELARVAPRQVLFSWDPRVSHRYWLLTDYLTQLPESEAGLPTLEAIASVLDVAAVWSVPVPWDCTDGFLGAYWRRPRMYLNPAARAAISGFARSDPPIVADVIARLDRDLADGTWNARYGFVLELDELDLGYRLVIAEGAQS